MDRNELIEALESHSTALAAYGMDVRDLVVLPPASEAQLAAVERKLGFALPPTLRATFARVTAGVSWSWWTESGVDLPVPFDQNFCGEVEWSLESLPDRHLGCLDWIENCFSNPDDPYDTVWHGKLGFAGVGNGDVIAADLDPRNLGAFVYLSHDDGEGHGFRLAASLDDLLDRWTPLAFAGPEDWQWLPFVPTPGGPIDPTCPNAQQWRSLLGLTWPG